MYNCIMALKRWLALIVTLLGSVLLLLPTGSIAASRPQGAMPPQVTAAILAGTDAPGRDLAALTLRLKLHGVGSIPSVVNASTPNYPAGTRHSFFVANITGRGYYSINATVRFVTPHAYWYVKDGFRVEQRYLEAAANRFEARIYPANRRVFGLEAPLGIDNDPRITVLVAPVQGVGGYFSSADTFPRAVNPYSNQRDMIYMAVVPEAGSGGVYNYFEATLAHEFQHMIEWNVKRDRDIWLDEGSSEIASHINGYDIGGTDYSFTLQPDTQLNAWSEVTESAAHYGASYLFLRFLMERYGGEGFMSALLKQNGLGVGAIDAVVKRAGNPAGFEGAFKDWTVANALNDASLAGGRYSYAEGGRIKPAIAIRQAPATRADSIHQYAADYIAISAPLASGGTIQFKGNPLVRVIGAEPHSGDSYWYSNRRDSGDATLTREFDLTRVRSATLRFWTWYDIEPQFDYAYVEASTDGGKSWATLKGKYTTTDNPNGASFGNAWTGLSTDVTGIPRSRVNVAKWVEEQASLSAYVGGKVLVRFEYVTDEGYNRPGWAVDDIRVPEIGYADNAESASGGWNAQGFVRIGGRVPERWFVALIETGAGPRRGNIVRQMVVDANGQGTIDLSPLGGRTARNDILVISPLAPKTTETGNWTVTVRAK